MELTSISEVILNPVAQSKFVHTVAAGVTASMFVLGVSPGTVEGRDVARHPLLRGRRRLRPGVGVLGDRARRRVRLHGGRVTASSGAIEAEWHTQKPPAAITAFGIPTRNERTDYEIKIPLLGLIATRSTDTPIAGIVDLRKEAAGASNGMVAHEALREAPQAATQRGGALQVRPAPEDHLGYVGLLLKNTPNVTDATPGGAHRPPTRYPKSPCSSGRSASWWASG